MSDLLECCFCFDSCSKQCCNNETQTKKAKKTLNTNQDVNTQPSTGGEQPGQVRMSRFSNLRY